MQELDGPWSMKEYTIKLCEYEIEILERHAARCHDRHARNRRRFPGLDFGIDDDIAALLRGILQQILEQK